MADFLRYSVIKIIRFIKYYQWNVIQKYSFLKKKKEILIDNIEIKDTQDYLGMSSYNMSPTILIMIS